MSIEIADYKKFCCSAKVERSMVIVRGDYPTGGASINVQREIAHPSGQLIHLTLPELMALTKCLNEINKGLYPKEELT